ncbi:MAG: transporter substrate-binding domain-containing protein [Alphaproteobacteria bacterium]|nr:transporter substrate-binding domain-containing protein [Alphaproteobacteria bacterium]
MFKRFVTVAAALAALVLAAPQAAADKFEDILKNGVVRIGVPVDVPPFGSVNAQRQPEGFDVDLANMVAKALGVKLEMQQITGANRIPFLLTDKIDIVIAIMGLTPERAKQITFTSPYVNFLLGVYGPKSAKVTNANELGSLKVVAPRGTTQELGLTGMNPRANIMRVEDDATSAAAYLSGQADLIATGNVVALDLAKKNPNKEFELKFVIRLSPGHMGVRMGEHNLARWLDSFIFFNTVNGELDKLHRKWLGDAMLPMPSL